MDVVSWNLAFLGYEAAKRQGGLLRQLAPDLMLLQADAVEAQSVAAHDHAVRSGAAITSSCNTFNLPCLPYGSQVGQPLLAVMALSWAWSSTLCRPSPGMTVW